MIEPMYCNRCTSNACFKSDSILTCYGCGFHTKNEWHKDIIQNLEEFEATIPELYKSLKYVDENGYYWYPQTINITSKGMVFADGESILNWKWCAVPAVETKKKNKSTYSMDMSQAEYFDERDFMEALDFIRYYEK